MHQKIEILKQYIHILLKVDVVLILATKYVSAIKIYDICENQSLPEIPQVLPEEQYSCAQPSSIYVTVGDVLLYVWLKNRNIFTEHESTFEIKLKMMKILMRISTEKTKINRDCEHRKNVYVN